MNPSIAHQAAQQSLIQALISEGLSDTRVIEALRRIPRHFFIDPSLSKHAYENTPLPIGDGQTISQPLIVALMTQTLALSPEHQVLEIGTGSGYQTAILSCLCQYVYTIERVERLFKQAKQRFQELGLHNILPLFGDGLKGWPQPRFFDRILVTAAATQTDPTAQLLKQLKVSGILLIPLGTDRFHQRLFKFQVHLDRIEQEALDDVQFVPLLPHIVHETF